jgi:hypothetical protein
MGKIRAYADGENKQFTTYIMEDVEGVNRKRATVPRRIFLYLVPLSIY